jgi:hypothetical protein
MRLNLGLPLLAKELLEQAARKRTYVIRVVYASLLFFSAFVFFFEILRIGSTSPLAALGKGREMFETLVRLQFGGVYLFMPAITCGILTLEKERASLPLLFVTRLGPWTIVIEKLMSRVIPMLGFLLLSLPLLAFAYSLGGISASQIGGAIWMLFLTTFQMGTVALLCSAWFRTTVGAFIGSYLLSLGLIFGPALILLIVQSVGFKVDMFLNSITSGPNIVFVPVIVIPLGGFAMWIDGPPAFRITSHFWPIVVQSGLIVWTSAMCLALARYFLVRRAFLAPRNILLGIFKRIDRAFHRLNDNRFTRGIVLGGSETAVPEGQPVAWRETQKRSLGRARYLVRVFLALEIPICVLCFMVAFPGAGVYRTDPQAIAALLFVLWGIAVMMVAVQSASLIAGEKSHQTLDVLCTTPLAGREIVLQKYRAVRRLMYVLLVPFCTIFYFHCAVKWNMGSYNNYTYRVFEMPLYLVASFLTVATYLPLVAWLSIAAGLLIKTQARAIIGATGGLVVWCVAPLLFVTMPLAIYLGSFGPLENRELIACTSLLSPAGIVPFNEFDSLRELGNPWLAVLVNFACYGALLASVRFACLRNADRWLGRMEGDVK